MNLTDIAQVWTDDDPEQFDAWLEELAPGQPQDKDDPGTLSAAGTSAQHRAAASMVVGRSVGLARKLVPGPGISVESWSEKFGDVAVGYDRIRSSCHGYGGTHLDGLNHIGWRGRWRAGATFEDAGAGLLPWSEQGIVTRALYVDVGSTRAEGHVTPEAPIRADEIDAVLSAAGLEAAPGDALLLDGGRDRYEATLGGHDAQKMFAGVGPSVARWVVDNGISVVCWDFMDAPIEPRKFLTVHRLIWAIGLAIVDNCDFETLRKLMAANGRADGCLVIGPVPGVAGATGCLVNPIVMIVSETTNRMGGTTVIGNAQQGVQLDRRKIGVLIPSTNTVVEPEFYAMAPAGVSVHAGRMHVTNPEIHDDDTTARLLSQVMDGLDAAVESLATAHLDLFVMGMSAPTFYGGSAGYTRLTDRIHSKGGKPVCGGSGSLVKAIHQLQAQRVAVLSPYQPRNDDEVASFLEEAGLTVTQVLSLRSTSATGIAETPPADIREAITTLARSGCDVIAQVGTNLPLVAAAAEAENALGVFVLPINTATMWDALRSLGIPDAMDGLGELFRNH